MQSVNPTDPIVYERNLDIRFADLDAFGHVNSAIYLDLVNSSRLIFLECKLGLPMSDIVKKGIGFYMTKATQEFLKPISGFNPVRVTSHISEVAGAKLIVPYEITNVDKSALYSRGVLEYFIMDLTKRKPTTMPDWLAGYFFKIPTSV